jgi:hypothetical protein
MQTFICSRSNTYQGLDDLNISNIDSSVSIYRRTSPTISLTIEGSALNPNSAKTALDA